MMSLWILVAAAALHSLLFDVDQATAFTPPDQCYPTPRYLSATGIAASTATVLFLASSEDIQAKLKTQMAKLQERDRSSLAVSSDVSDLIAAMPITFPVLLFSLSFTAPIFDTNSCSYRTSQLSTKTST